MNQTQGLWERSKIQTLFYTATESNKFAIQTSLYKKIWADRGPMALHGKSKLLLIA